jgi:hypothetical protein
MWLGEVLGDPLAFILVSTAKMNPPPAHASKLRETVWSRSCALSRLKRTQERLI